MTPGSVSIFVGLIDLASQLLLIIMSVKALYLGVCLSPCNIWRKTKTTAYCRFCWQTNCYSVPWALITRHKSQPDDCYILLLLPLRLLLLTLQTFLKLWLFKQSESHHPSLPPTPLPPPHLCVFASVKPTQQTHTDTNTQVLHLQCQKIQIREIYFEQ